MTLGIFAPVMAALASMLVVVRALSALQSLPTAANTSFDPARRMRVRRAIVVSLFAALAMPGLLWLALNRLSDAGLMELF
jgi:hypothetical protein